MRFARPVLLAVLVSMGCGYARSAARVRLSDDGDAIRAQQAAAAQRANAIRPDGVRDLDDEIFSTDMAEMGLFDPHEFLEQAPAMVYAPGKQEPGKIPVVFVHGMRGTPRDFRAVVAELDLARYQPWFFYYPSGADLQELSTTFYRIFLSGRSLRTEDAPLVIVAHSMGGLVVRAALNLCTGERGENRVARLVTVASPMGGLDSAAGAAEGLLVIRSWRGLDPKSRFVAGLHHRPLPQGLRYTLFFTFGNSQWVKPGLNGDGVVSLASQLDPAAQDEATAVFGLDDTHAGVLQAPDAVRRIAAAAEGRAGGAEGPR
jgi:pimeloyl-ACP methyl ester carboxylesterase